VKSIRRIFQSLVMSTLVKLASTIVEELSEDADLVHLLVPPVQGPDAGTAIFSAVPVGLVKLDVGGPEGNAPSSRSTALGVNGNHVIHPQ